MMQRRTWALALGLAATFAWAGTAGAQEVYIPLVSKGFQHQFWQAVKSRLREGGDRHSTST